MPISEQATDKLSYELGLFFHRELDRRYRQEYLEEIDELRSSGLVEKIPQSHIERIKEFFKRVMYPIGDERRYQDKGFETVTSIMSSASSIISLLPRMPRLILRHGGRLPATSDAGVHVVSSYETARRLEEEVLDSLIELCEEEGIPLEENPAIPHELFQRAYGTLRTEDTEHMLDQTEHIVRLGTDDRLMAATMDIVTAVKEARRDADERDALGYVESILQEVQSLYDEFSDDDVERIIELSKIVEARYFSSLQGGR